MSQVFLRQAEAAKFVAEISDPQERVLTELAFNRSISFLMGDKDYLKRCLKRPFDLLFLVRTVHAFVRRKDVLARVLSGEITSIDDLDPFN